MLKSEEFFEKIRATLEKSGAEIVKKVGATFLFELRAKKDS